MRKSIRWHLAIGITIAGLVTTLLPATAAASTRHEFEGPIVSVNRDRHTFKMSDRHRGIVKIKANSETRYEDLSGFNALDKGLRVDVKAKRSNGRWIAIEIDRDSPGD